MLLNTILEFFENISEKTLRRPPRRQPSREKEVSMSILAPQNRERYIETYKLFRFVSIIR